MIQFSLKLFTMNMKTWHSYVCDALKDHKVIIHKNSSEVEYMTGIFYNMYHCIVSGSTRRGNSVSKWCLQGDSVHCAGPRQVGVYTSIFLFTLTYN